MGNFYSSFQSFSLWSNGIMHIYLIDDRDYKIYLDVEIKYME